MHVDRTYNLHRYTGIHLKANINEEFSVKESRALDMTTICSPTTLGYP